MPIPIPIIDNALKLINNVVDKAVPDADKRIALKAELAAQVVAGEFDTQIASINAVNATMQAEAKSEHWMQWAWRPSIGFTFCFVIINNFVILPYFGWAKEVVIPGEVWNAMLVILGASAVVRGLEKRKDK